ncbi:MAG: CPBP family intramembrane glutamic endopeptidase, partial [Planctomyces sp.]
AEQRREMFVYRLVPGNGREWALKVVVAVTAGVAEEAVYRGVLLQILWYSLDSFTAAVAVSAVAFALAHRQQGLQSMLLIVLIALQMHWLVQSTGSLLGAMAAHTLYDIVAMFWIARQAKRDAVIASL